MFTTHSPLVVEALQVADLAVVRSTGGTTTVTGVPVTLGEAQGTARAAPSALLSRRVGVGEGATEVGLLRGLHQILDPRRAAVGLDTSAVTGFAISNGTGNKACPRAATFAALGYPSVVLIDNDDRTVDAAAAAAAADGVVVLRWDHGLAVEHQLARDLEIDGLQDFLDIAASENSSTTAALRDAVHARLPRCVDLPGGSVADWVGAAEDSNAVRAAIGSAAHARGWFKREDHGVALAGLVDRHWEALAVTTTGAVLSSVLQFIYNDPDASFLRPVEAT